MKTRPNYFLGCPTCGHKNEQDLDDLFPPEFLGDPQEQYWSDVRWCPECGTVSEEYGQQRIHAPRNTAWIPVTERLPDVGAVVLVFDPAYDHVHCAKFEQHYGRDFWVEQIEQYGTFAPTHWMPLPAPPKDTTD